MIQLLVKIKQNVKGYGDIVLDAPILELTLNFLITNNIKTLNNI